MAVIDIPKLRADRLRVLDAVFDLAGGDEDIMVNGINLSFQLDLDDTAMADAVRWLSEECLVKPSTGHNGRRTSSWLQITHAGIVAVEQARSEPGSATGQFPAHITITQTFHGNVTGVAFQQASLGAQQAVTHAGPDDPTL